MILVTSTRIIESSFTKDLDQIFTSLAKVGSIDASFRDRNIDERLPFDQHSSTECGPNRASESTAILRLLLGTSGLKDERPLEDREGKL